MSKRHTMRRGWLCAAAALIGASAATVSFALPAGATTLPNYKNSLIVGGGSNTTYVMMTQLGDLFNESPGCNLTAPSGSSQDLNYACPSPANTTGGENGLSDGGGYLGAGDPENPYNDVTVEEPPLGSSNGIKELEGRGAPAGTSDGALDFARSSRGPNNGSAPPVGYGGGTPSNSDPSGLNFVAYAADAVPYLHWTEVKKKKTPSAAVTNLTVAQLKAIYNGTDTNWSQVGGTSGPIDVYTAQSGSGTESTFATETGITTTGACLFPAVTAEPNCSSHVIFENEIGSILKNGDEANAIFFFSYGKFQTDCDAATASCGADKSPAKSKMALGNEEVAAGDPPIAPGSSTILNGTYPGDRYLYNVYSNGTNGTIPASSTATLNFVSEVGFICKQDPAVDSNSEAATPANQYGAEIQKVITVNGFFPLPLANIEPSGTSPADDSFAGTAISGDPGYAFDDPAGTSGENGSTQTHCRLFTTDNDGTS